ncbi:MAG: 4Fe-4S cluster-binding domain-containing protein [Desulfobacterales bacterium]
MTIALSSPAPATEYRNEEQKTVDGCRKTLEAFLEQYVTRSLVGDEFVDAIGEGDGRTRLFRLAERCGFPEDPEALIRKLADRLVNLSGEEDRTVELGGIRFPYLLLVALLERIEPGDNFTSVRTVDQLESLTGTPVREGDRGDLQKVLDLYPVRLSRHVVRQMRLSRNVAYQYLPFVEELDPVGQVNTWIGQFHQGLLEQMYRNRVIFLLNMSCPVYCRFCFRKHKDSRRQANPAVADIRRSVDYVAQTPSIKEIVITGGDPFMNRANLACAVDGLMEVPHVQTLRLATRSIAYYPQLFTAGDDSLLKFVVARHYALQARGKRMEIATHFIHPDEVSIQSLELITALTGHGIPVYIQTPFLKDCNDRGPELVRLYHLLRGAGAELHYIYIPCSPIQGNSIYWTPISKGIDVAHYLRANLSDRVIPRICTATPIGKIDWHSSGWAVERDTDNSRFIWIRTPYTPEYFKAFAPLAEDYDMVRLNAEGTIDARFMAEMGDEALFLGSRRLSVSTEPSPCEPARHEEALDRMLSDRRLPESIVETGAAGIRRLHLTRVLLDLDLFDGNLDYLRRHPEVTDVVLAAEGDILDRLWEIERIVEEIGALESINAVRLRSLRFNSDPSGFTRALIERIGRMNRLTVAAPLRVEIETQFLHGTEVGPEHRRITEKLRNHGVTVYANTMLLAGVNDSPDVMNDLAYRLRAAGIEFHHLYVAGQPMQNDWGRDRPVTVSRAIDIATRVRRDGSGREIPRYILQTPLGEVDFGLTSVLFRRNGGMSAKLSPYRIGYYRRMKPDFQWPEGVFEDEDGSPVLPVAGLEPGDGFMVF